MNNSLESYIYILFEDEQSKSNEMKNYSLRKIRIAIDSSKIFSKQTSYKDKNFEKQEHASNSVSDDNYQSSAYSDSSSYTFSEREATQSSEEDSEKIIVRNFKEDLGTYTINKYYKKQIEKNKIYFELENEIQITDTIITNYKIHISKSIRYIILITQKNSKESANPNEKKNSNRNFNNPNPATKMHLEVKYFSEDLKLINNFYIREDNLHFKGSEVSIKPADTDVSIIDSFKEFKIFYNFVYAKLSDAILISQIENLDNFILTCDLSNFLLVKDNYIKDPSKANTENSNEPYKAHKDFTFTYDQINNFLFILNEGLEILIFYPFVKSTHVKNKIYNSCNFIKLFKSFDLLNILGLDPNNADFKRVAINLVKLDIIRSDLIIIFNELGKILFINLEKFDEQLEQNNFEFRVVDLNNFNSSKDIFPFDFNFISHQHDQIRLNYSTFIASQFSPDIIYSKNTFSNFILIQNFVNPNIIMIFELYNPHSKLVGGDYSFLNFKIPIVFVAMIVIFFYHFYKKKKELNNETPEMKKEVFKYLEDQGVFKKTFKEEKENNPIARSGTNYPAYTKEYADEDLHHKDNQADESINDIDENCGNEDSDKLNDEIEFKRKIMQFLKNKS